MNPTMTIFWQRYGLTAIFGLVSLGLLAAIGFETGFGSAIRRSLPSSNSAAGTSDILATLPLFALPSLDSAFKETGERPLFTPSRRPAAVNLAANVPAMKKGQFKLNGTSVSNDLALAFLFETATGKTVRITKGKEINGMTLETVEANRIVLKQGEETEELTLRTAASPPAPPRPPVPMPNAPGAPGMQPMPGNPGMVAPPANVQPVAGVNVGAGPQPPIRPQPVGNPLVPLPGQSQLPGFVLSPGAAAAQAAPPAEDGNTQQRRRRFPGTPQQ